jgi:hypothetical protein
MAFDALSEASVAGPPLWTGGAFGVEGGLVATGVLAVTVVGLEGLRRKGLGIRG